MRARRAALAQFLVRLDHGAAGGCAWPRTAGERRGTSDRFVPKFVTPATAR